MKSNLKQCKTLEERLFVRIYLYHGKCLVPVFHTSTIFSIMILSWEQLPEQNHDRGNSANDPKICIFPTGQQPIIKKYEDRGLGANLTCTSTLSCVFAATCERGQISCNVIPIPPRLLLRLRPEGQGAVFCAVATKTTWMPSLGTRRPHETLAPIRSCVGTRP